MMNACRFARSLILGLFLVIAFSSCEDDDPTRATIDYSGRYYVTIGPSPLFTIDLSLAGADVTFLLQGDGLEVGGAGTVTGGRMILTGDIPGAGSVGLDFLFAADGQTFSGSWELVSDVPSQGTLTGTRAAWAVHDVELNRLPLFATADCTDLSRIWRVSKFRSGAGHDYSDDFESCRSMKHYYQPPLDANYELVALHSPVTGQVIGLTDEWADSTTWKGKAIGIRPEGLEAFHVIIYHVNPAGEPAVGDRVVAGELLGASQKRSGTAADLAIGLQTPSGHRLISFFQVMTDAVFELYQERGVETCEAGIWTREARDADPLTCQGEQFTTSGQLGDWVVLD